MSEVMGFLNFLSIIILVLIMSSYFKDPDLGYYYSIGFSPQNNHGSVWCNVAQVEGVF
jgi:hypothetical protein